MISNKFSVWIFLLALVACKSQSTLISPHSTFIRDSVSVTYKQGTEQPASIDAIGAQIESRKNSSVPADGTVGVGATQGASVFEGLLSERTNKKAVPLIRVDTVFIERWHTEQADRLIGGKAGRSRDRPKPFYKNCTIGFWVLLVFLFSRLAFRIFKAIYLKR